MGSAYAKSTSPVHGLLEQCCNAPRRGRCSTCAAAHPSRRARSASATDHAWNGQPVASCGASPSAVSETEPRLRAWPDWAADSRGSDGVGTSHSRVEPSSIRPQSGDRTESTMISPPR